MSLFSFLKQGEFSDGLRCGYGIENNFDEGTKYIGYWQDDKKHGPGIFIQPDGSYFEGVFFQNNLVGNALALFSNGSYYQGEMASIEAPIRHGMLCNIIRFSFDFMRKFISFMIYVFVFYNILFLHAISFSRI